MDYIIDGGTQLFGEIAVYGAKNCALPLLGASVLTDEAVVLDNCPRITDVLNMIKLLESMGKKVVWRGNSVEVGGRLTTTQAPQSLAKLLRGSALILGSVIAAYGEIELPLPGGCAIGARPMDIHLDGLEKMGVETNCYGNSLYCRGKPCGTNYNLRFASVGATENLLCASVLAEGETVLTNCATEPEVEALEQMLSAMGAQIEGIGTPTLTVKGVKKLRGTQFTVIPDRIVAATYISAVVASGGKATVTNCNTKHLRAFLNVLYPHFGIKEYLDAVTISCEKQPAGYGRIYTAPYPFFPTDMQSLVLSMASFSNGGHTYIRENLFENRLSHIANELSRMGADIKVEDNFATVSGKSLRGAEVCAYDLRGGAALVVAGLNAAGRTTLRGVHNISRGYLDLAENLNRLGAKISIV